jgi:hypothetical protein
MTEKETELYQYIATGNEILRQAGTGLSSRNQQHLTRVRKGTAGLRGALPERVDCFVTLAKVHNLDGSWELVGGFSGTEAELAALQMIIDAKLELQRFAADENKNTSTH